MRWLYEYAYIYEVKIVLTTHQLKNDVCIYNNKIKPTRVNTCNKSYVLPVDSYTLYVLKRRRCSNQVYLVHFLIIRKGDLLEMPIHTVKFSHENCILSIYCDIFLSKILVYSVH